MLILVCSVLALVTSMLFWMWPQADLKGFETHQAEDRHQRIAESLATQLAEFGFDLNHLVEMVAWDLPQLDHHSRTVAVLADKGIRRVCVYRSDTGALSREVLAGPISCDEELSTDVASYQQVSDTGFDVSVLSPLTVSDKDEACMYLVRARGAEIAVAVIAPEYIENLGNSIRFGDLGHVAIVDQAGTVLSHPLPEWLEERRNLGSIDAFKNTLEGFSGTQRFFSPALKADMIAGSARVPVFGWAVLVPQPVSEITSIIRRYDNLGLVVLAIGLLLATIFASILGFLIANPLFKVTRVANQVSGGDLDVEFPRLDNSPFVPKEIRTTNQAIRDMTERLRDNAERLEYLANTDAQTRLSNRQHFMDRARSIFDSRHSKPGVVSLMFIDLDGFKKINDTHGHRVGDEVLEVVASRIRVAISGFRKRSEMGNDVVAARLGGDEFAILTHAKSRDDFLEFAQRLQQQLVQPVAESVEVNFGSSVGIAFADSGDLDLVGFLHEADSAMYLAKASGRSPQIANQSSKVQRLPATGQP